MKEYILTEEDLSSMQLLFIDRFKELVMCKDCKHRPKIDEEDVENYTASGFSLEFPDDFECPCRCEDPYYSWMPKDDWYCGNGERKEE